jgi:hypothetical protein
MTIEKYKHSIYTGKHNFQIVIMKYRKLFSQSMLLAILNKLIIREIIILSGK